MYEINLKISDQEDLSSVDVSCLAIVLDFQVHLREAGQFGKHVDFCDGGGNRLASFPWLDHADEHLSWLFPALRDAVPSSPYSDLEQSWEILIWRDRDTYVVLEGTGEPCGVFEVGFRVEADQFLEAWNDPLRQPQVSFCSVEAAAAHAEQAVALSLGNQRLTAIPEPVLKLPQLEYLNLYLNRLDTLPPAIGELTRLRWLDLRFNRIRFLPEEMSRLIHLESINLAQNRLEELPPWVADLPKLRTFHVPSNPVRRDSLERMRRLRPDIDFG